MAEAVLSSVLTVILGNLNSQVLEEFGTATVLKTEIGVLKSTCTTIQAVLQDAEAKQWKSEAIRNWLRKLKVAAYDADNILDEISTEALILRVNRERGVKHRVSAFFSDRNPVLFHVKMGRKVKNIRERLDAIAEERSKFHLKEGVVDLEVGDMDSRHTSSLINESEIIGRNEEKEMIIELLVSNLPDQYDDLSVYAIRGMGGLGKTTLAQLVYNDERIRRHFELHIWVCVSQDFDIRRLTRAIIESIEGSSCSISELDPLQLRLQEKLRGRRFLLVLDDVWYEYHEKWDGLKKALQCGVKGSTVIITTRLEKVALIMATLPVHHMGCLSEDDSWSLFRRRAFGIGTEDYLKLESIGKAIVKKCGGLPLAVKALGSLMQLKRRESQWLSVKESEIWDLSDEGSSILPALRLSFDNLPPHSRQCFVYSSIFSKNCTMEKDALIQLWMANGFIPARGNTDQHLIGSEIFENLIWRSFFEDAGEDFKGQRTCKMHDLMHDLARFIMRDECLVLGQDRVLKIPENCRHFYCDSRLSLRSIPWIKDMIEVRSIRSFFLLDKGYNPVDTSLYISKQRYLRVLDLRGSSTSLVQKVQDSIGNLKHLRYLDVSNHRIKTLPESTSCLQNLQTLKLNYCSDLRKLPKGMKYLRNLQHLDIKGCTSLACMPEGMEQLTSLQTLSTFIVGQDRGHQIRELRELNLGGELSIEGLDNVRDPVDAKSANLKGKNKLTSLFLSWGNRKKGNLPANDEEVLENLQPHLDLKKLRIHSYQGSQFPNRMFDSSMQNLVKVALTECGRCEWLPSLGKLPFLKVLSLYRMDAIKSFDNSFCGDGESSFPALRQLELIDLRMLEGWKTGDRGVSFPFLQDVTIDTCPRLTELPHLPSLANLKILCSNAKIVEQVRNLTSISSLEISYCDELRVLPLGLAQNPKVFESLEVIRVFHCKHLESLSEGIQHLTTLRDLVIIGCPELKYLPCGLKSLCKIKCLRIDNCPHLERRCEKETGEDWPNIAHIPAIYINHEFIQDLGP